MPDVEGYPIENDYLEIARSISDVAPLLPDEAKVFRLAFGRGSLHDPHSNFLDEENSDKYQAEWSLWRQRLHELRPLHQTLLVDSLWAAYDAKSVTLRYVRTFAAEEPIVHYKRMGLGELTILKAFGPTNTPVKRIARVQPQNVYL